MKKTLIIGIFVILTSTLAHSIGVHSQESSSPVPHFWVVTSSQLSTTLNASLDQYIADITPVLRHTYPQIVVEKRSVALDLNASSNRQAQNIINVLANGFHEDRLIGAFLIGVPVPTVISGKEKTSSTLPYGDFENVFYTYSALTDQFSHLQNSENENPHPEIMLGVLPDLGTNGFNSYFEAHHTYFSAPSTYNKAIFFNDQINDQKLLANIKQTVLSPIGTQAFNPGNYVDALNNIKNQWQSALNGSHRWQDGTSVNSEEVQTSLEGWNNEPALQTLRKLLPTIQNYFFNQSEPSTLADQENTIGSLLTELGAFSSPIAIQSRFFQSTNLTPTSDTVCSTTSPFPALDTEEFAMFRAEFNSLQGWITNIPRGSLLAEAPEAGTVAINGSLANKYFIIRPGEFVSSATGEPVQLKTILVDPSVITKELTIPRTGFNHPGVLEREVPSWNQIELNNDQINELISWNYFLTTDDQYIYLLKNRLPPINQFAFLPDTYEVVINNIDQQLSNKIISNCLSNRSAETKSLLTIFTGFNATQKLGILNDELASGKSLAVLAANSNQASRNASFDKLPTTLFAGLTNPPALTSFASSSMLGQALMNSMNEKLNLFGDPCITLHD